MIEYIVSIAGSKFIYTSSRQSNPKVGYEDLYFAAMKVWNSKKWVTDKVYIRADRQDGIENAGIEMWEVV